jgi:RND family efflux transporter MFP subunit
LANFLAAATALGCHENPSAPTPVAAQKAVAPKEVVVVTAHLQPWPKTVSIQGSLLADEDAVIGSKVAGRVDSVAVDLGSVVKRGDPLVLLDRREFALQVQLAESQLQQACAAIGLTPTDDETKLEYKNAAPVRLEQALVDQAQAALNRAQQLLQTRAVTGGEFDALVAQHKAAQARYDSALNSVSQQVSLIGVRRTELAMAQQQFVDAHIVAPFDGIVDERRVSPGEYVQVGQAVVTLVRTDRLRLTAGVPESKAGPIRAGQSIEIRVAGKPNPVRAAISRVSPLVTQTSRSVRIEADVANPKLELQAGLFAEADIVIDPNAEALSLPATAVSRFAGVQKVWLVKDGQARQQTIRTGREMGNRVEILEGLNAGDVIVATAADGHDGPVIAVDEKAVSGQLSAMSDQRSAVSGQPKNNSKDSIDRSNLEPSSPASVPSG